MKEAREVHTDDSASTNEGSPDVAIDYWGELEKRGLIKKGSDFDKSDDKSGVGVLVPFGKYGPLSVAQIKSIGSSSSGQEKRRWGTPHVLTEFEGGKAKYFYLVYDESTKKWEKIYDNHPAHELHAEIGRMCIDRPFGGASSSWGEVKKALCW